MYRPDEFIALLKEEIRQRREEGCRVIGFDRRIRRAGKAVDKLNAAYDDLMALKPEPRLAKCEPNDLAGIRRLRPPGPRRIKSPTSTARLRDRLRGAFLGRCAGCLLGKPVEDWHRDRIFKALKKDHRFPLDYYFESSTIRAGGKPFHPAGVTYCTFGHFDHMERDDDTDYTILGVHSLKTYGPKFTTANVAHEWQMRLPYFMTYTAERMAYRNLVNGLPLDQVPIYRNPFREWIGAQIRADGFGYCAAGMPQLAAEFAHRDAVLSHTKNGIYGEMLFAAMIAAAAVCNDVEEVIQIGLSEIPTGSRLAVAVRDVIEWAGENRDWQETLDAIHERYGHYHSVHTINNACLVIMGLLHGRMDFGKTICMTVMGGWDTDCTGATAGSVLGAMLGADRLPAKWIKPLNNRLESIVIGYNDVKITDIADAALKVNRKIRVQKRMKAEG
ncbi:MAG: ADP-ribosylglycohydrolase family protein [Phycisphaerae bacterium]|nr:ADP-ribosylglycohydrolase family protein [Phycisphaerae bacterium]